MPFGPSHSCIGTLLEDNLPSAVPHRVHDQHCSSIFKKYRRWLAEVLTTLFVDDDLALVLFGKIENSESGFDCLGRRAMHEEKTEDDTRCKAESL